MFLKIIPNSYNNDNNINLYKETNLRYWKKDKEKTPKYNKFFAFFSNFKPNTEKSLNSII